jgi:hypothetical protein
MSIFTVDRSMKFFKSFTHPSAQLRLPQQVLDIKKSTDFSEFKGQEPRAATPGKMGTLQKEFVICEWLFVIC